VRACLIFSILVSSVLKSYFSGAVIAMTGSPFFFGSGQWVFLSV
jgi:hypothetical protein